MERQSNMLKYTDFDIVFQEIPDEVKLAINISNCPCGCAGCLSPQLADDIGDALTASEVDTLLEKYGAAVTCVCLMGGDADPAAVNALAAHIRMKGKKSAWYSGRAALPDTIDTAHFDFIKLGPYIAERGGLKSPTTNQRLFRIECGQMHDITDRFWPKKEFTE